MSQDLVLHMRRLKDLWCEYDVDLRKRSLSRDYISYKSFYILNPNMEICCGKKLKIIHDERYDTPLVRDTYYLIKVNMGMLLNIFTQSYYLKSTIRHMFQRTVYNFESKNTQI